MPNVSNQKGDHARNSGQGALGMGGGLAGNETVGPIGDTGGTGDIGTAKTK